MGLRVRVFRGNRLLGYALDVSLRRSEFSGERFGDACFGRVSRALSRALRLYSQLYLLQGPCLRAFRGKPLGRVRASPERIIFGFPVGPYRIFADGIPASYPDGGFGGRFRSFFFRGLRERPYLRVVLQGK